VINVPTFFSVDFEHDFLLDHESNQYKNFLGEREVSSEQKSAFLWEFDQN
jgi:hypothetical protein